MLVVDLDGQLLAPLRTAEEILLTLGAWEDDDRENPAPDTEPLRLPEPLAGRVAVAAMRRLLTTLAPTQSRAPGNGRLLAPDGRYEHAPQTVVTLPPADIALLSATAVALGHPGLDRDDADLVGTVAGQLGSVYRRGRPHRAGLAPRPPGRPARPRPPPTTPGCSPPGCRPPHPAASAYSATPRRPPTPALPTG